MQRAGALAMAVIGSMGMWGGAAAAADPGMVAAPPQQAVRLRFVLRSEGADARDALAAQNAALRKLSAALRSAGVATPPMRTRLAVTRMPVAMPERDQAPGAAPTAAAPAKVMALGRFSLSLTQDRQVAPALQAALMAGAVWAEAAAPRHMWHVQDRPSWAAAVPMRPAAG